MASDESMLTIKISIRRFQRIFFPVPHIDQLIDMTYENEMLSFLEAFSRYHYIFMVVEDVLKTTFITYQNIYAYKKIVFGFLNQWET